MGLTKGNLYLLNKRVSEIEKTLDLCCDKFDLDIITNLESELDNIYNMLESSLESIKGRQNVTFLYR